MNEIKNEIGNAEYQTHLKLVTEYLQSMPSLEKANITIDSPIVKQLLYVMQKYDINPIMKDAYIVPFKDYNGYDNPQLIISYTKLMEIGANAIPNYAGYYIMKGPFVNCAVDIERFTKKVLRTRSLPEFLEVTIYQYHGDDRVVISSTTLLWEDCAGSSPIWKTKPYYMYEKTALANAFRKIPQLDLAGAIIPAEFEAMEESNKIKSNLIKKGAKIEVDLLDNEI